MKNKIVLVFGIALILSLSLLPSLLESDEIPSCVSPCRGGPTMCMLQSPGSGTICYQPSVAYH